MECGYKIQYLEKDAEMQKKLKLNTITSLIFEIVSIVCGFILPRLIMGQYGSNINGLVNSISQFIGIITFLELGVGKVVQSALYKPLADKDNNQISRVMVSAGKFFKRIALIMLTYIIILIIIYPYISGRQFGWLYSATLIAAMSISSFAQYYFGIINRLLLTADQKGYIQYTAQTLTLVINTLACVLLIRFGVSIHIVKLTTSIVFLMRPVYLAWYVRRHYDINYKIKYEGEPIKQKWNGLAQHVAYVVLNDTDTIVLTILGTFSDVSIYAAYHLVVYGVKRLFTSMMNGIEAYLGNLWARQDEKGLQNTFNMTEWLVHTAVIFVFGCTGFLIVPFIQCYTNGITDANYIQPIFAALIVMAHACHCLRLPYNLMIFAAGHYKETQYNYIIATIMNIVISISCVKKWGLVGVAIGTLVSMLYQTIWMAFYNAKNLVKRPMGVFAKQCIVDAITVVCYTIIPFERELANVSYLNWLKLAIEIAVAFMGVSIIVNLVFYRKYLLGLPKMLKSRR